MPRKHIWIWEDRNKREKTQKPHFLVKHALWQHVFAQNVTAIKLRWIELKWTERQREGVEKRKQVREEDMEKRESIRHTDRHSSRETAAHSKMTAPCVVNEIALSVKVHVHVHVCVHLNKHVCLRQRTRAHSLLPLWGAKCWGNRSKQAAKWFPFQKH